MTFLSEIVKKIEKTFFENIKNTFPEIYCSGTCSHKTLQVEITSLTAPFDTSSSGFFFNIIFDENYLLQFLCVKIFLKELDYYQIFY